MYLELPKFTITKSYKDLIKNLKLNDIRYYKRKNVTFFKYFILDNFPEFNFIIEHINDTIYYVSAYYDYDENLSINDKENFNQEIKKFLINEYGKHQMDNEGKINNPFTMIWEDKEKKETIFLLINKKEINEDNQYHNIFIKFKFNEIDNSKLNFSTKILHSICGISGFIFCLVFYLVFGFSFGFTLPNFWICFIGGAGFGLIMDIVFLLMIKFSKPNKDPFTNKSLLLNLDKREIELFIEYKKKYRCLTHNNSKVNIPFLCNVYLQDDKLELMFFNSKTILIKKYNDIKCVHCYDKTVVFTNTDDTTNILLCSNHNDAEEITNFIEQIIIDDFKKLGRINEIVTMHLNKYDYLNMIKLGAPSNEFELMAYHISKYIYAEAKLSYDKIASYIQMYFADMDNLYHADCIEIAQSIYCDLLENNL